MRCLSLRKKKQVNRRSKRIEEIVAVATLEDEASRIVKRVNPRHSLLSFDSSEMFACFTVSDSAIRNQGCISFISRPLCLSGSLLERGVDFGEGREL